MIIIKILSVIYLKEGNLGNAQDRASLALQVVQYLCSLESGKPEDTNGSGDTDETIKRTVEFVREFAQPVDVEEQEHDGMYIARFIAILLIRHTHMINRFYIILAA